MLKASPFTNLVKSTDLKLHLKMLIDVDRLSSSGKEFQQSKDL